MNIRKEINNHAAPDDKAILLWLFEKYHWQSQWSFVTRLKWEGKPPDLHPVFKPTEEGYILYNHAHPTK